MPISVSQKTAQFSREELDRMEACIVICEAGSRKSLPAFPYGDVVQTRLKRLAKEPCPTEPFDTDLPNSQGTRLVVACVKPDSDAFSRLTLARQLCQRALAADPKQVAVVTLGEDPAAQRRNVEALVAALLAGTFSLPSYKTKPPRTKRLAAIHIYGLDEKADFKRVQAEAEGNNLARRLTAMPPNKLTPALYRKEIQALAKEYGWKMEFLTLKRLRQENAGAFVAVAEGSENDEAGIVHLRYDGASRRKGTTKALALVGKGICFDTGGNNLKPPKSMHGMHEDMAGSAAALGVLVALTRLKLDFPVDCWLALAENLIGPKAYKQNDVITAANGVTIEVVHTDAEGRMVLADSLYLASKAGPQLVVDYATLTGSCIYALGTRYSGAFTNREPLLAKIISAGRESGERVWPFPMDADYDSELDSQVADVKQCPIGGEADHIMGARFLQRFVNDTPWIHLDLAAGNHKGGLAHIPTDTTGFGVRFTLNLLLDQGAMM